MFQNYKSEQLIATTILENSITNNKLSHAYIFETNNYPKAYELVVDFVKNILCSKHNDLSHDETTCPTCSQINSNNYIEFKVIDTEKMQIKKEELINLQEEFKNKAFEGKKKIYLIKCAEKLNPSSSNTILKFLEEPEENIIAILMTPSRYMLLKTITSRCQIISLLNNSLDDNIITYVLKIVNPDVKTEEEKKEYVLLKIESLIKFIEYFEKHKKDTLLFTKDLVFKNFSVREDLLVFFEMLKLFYYDILTFKTKEKVIYYKDFIDDVVSVSKNNKLQSIAKKLQLIEKSIEKIKLNVNLNLIIDKFIIESEGV